MTGFRSLPHAAYSESVEVLCPGGGTNKHVLPYPQLRQNILRYLLLLRNHYG